MIMIVCGVVIAKQELKILDKDPNKRAQSVMNFTIRDSERYFINAICWLPPSDMAALSAAFSIADVVALVYPQIRKQKIDSSPFVPWTEMYAYFYIHYKRL
ncbi:unnamed protein product [Didymodactylos carnosus]|uniref:MEIOB-like N-terminal domain-containing protein n=1 Tax=Didymodactylos carnosus TaxID=1234261 RepID=A0A8S2FBS0_9BILA|nr:unnamed protein product [Didymodactylos carnosus]CAF4218419.1 unnamed protein product [Didymodactylos carnosus]